MSQSFKNLSSRFFLLIFISFLAVSLASATRLATRNQENRSRAADTVSTSKVSFKIAFKGVKPSSACLESLKAVKVEAANVPTNIYQSGIIADLTPVSGQTNIDGNQVFLVSNLPLNAKFNSVDNFNYLRIKGPNHLASRMCLNNQNTKLDEITTCDINLKETNPLVYDFSNYSLFSGDIDQDGIINVVDYSIIKNRFRADANVSCGQEADINYDGIVNSLDAVLFKESLSRIEDGQVIIKPTSTPTKTPTPTRTPTAAPALSPADYTTFHLTFYTSLPIENGGYADMACGGKIAAVKQVIYVANNVYPCGTKIYLEGYGIMTVKDRGGKSFDSKTRLDVLIPRNPGESDNAYFKRVNDKGRPTARGYVIK